MKRKRGRRPLRHTFHRPIGASVTKAGRDDQKRRRTCDGILFDSILECRYYRRLQQNVEVEMFLRQVGFDLPGGLRYRVDFVEFRRDGSVHFVDVKGYLTSEFVRNKKQVEALYPGVTIETPGLKEKERPA